LKVLKLRTLEYLKILKLKKSILLLRPIRY